MMYQVKLSEGYEVRVAGDYCSVHNRDGKQKFSGNHDQVQQWCAQRGLSGFGAPPAGTVADCTVTGCRLGQRVKVITTDTAYKKMDGWTGAVEIINRDEIKAYVKWDQDRVGGTNWVPLKFLALEAAE